MEAALRVTGLVKRFGKREALRGISFSIPKLSIAAFVGSNGAGKTTTFSLIGGFFKPNSGTIEVEGMPLAQFRAQGGIVGVLPQDVMYFENRSVERHLVLFAKLAGLSGREVWEEVRRVLKLVALEDRASDLVATLSHGMRVRLGVAQALVGNPPVVLLDEPTQGLDPKMAMTFRNCVDSLRGTTTLVISSHDLSQLQLMCDYVVMVDHGQVVREGPIKSLLAQSSRITFRLDEGNLDLQELEGHFPEFRFTRPEARLLFVQFNPGEFQIPEVNSRVLFWLFRHKVGVLGVESQRSLEQSYFEATSSPPR
jgi:ABC-type multidrug transport system ATPase subunit